MEILVAPEAEVPPPLRAQVLALHEQAWPSAEADEAAEGHDPVLEPLSMLLVDDGRVLAALDILWKDLDHGGERYRAAGLSTVVTDRSRRQQGHGARLVRAAREEMAARGADLGVFTCDEPLAHFYEEAGFEVLPGTQLIGGTPQAPFPSGPLAKVTLAAFFTERSAEHRADFEHAEVRLFPGTIDRLW